jgi:hypothetical protein
MPLSPPQNLGHRPLLTQTPEIPEYWRELPVKTPWRSTGAPTDAAFWTAALQSAGRRSPALDDDG